VPGVIRDGPGRPVRVLKIDDNARDLNARDGEVAEAVVFFGDFLRAIAALLSWLRV
jgi:hypothetical protein